MYDDDDDSDEVGGFIIDLDDGADPHTVALVVAALEAIDGVIVTQRNGQILCFGEAWEEARDAAMTVLYLHGHFPALGEAGDA